MKKVLMGILCVVIAVIIAVSMVGCNGGSDELTFSSDPQQSSADSQQSTASQSGDAASDVNKETVLYLLTTQQGETVQVLSTTMPTTELSTVNYDPVSVPAMDTTVYNTTVTVYQPPTYSDSEKNKVTTKPSTTKPASTEKKTSYASVDGTAGTENGKIIVDFQLSSGDDTVDAFSKKFGKLEAKKGTATLTYDGEEYKTNCSVMSSLVGGEARVYIDIPSEIAKVMDSGEEYTISIFIPKGTIVGSKGVENKAVYVPLSEY